MPEVEAEFLGSNTTTTWYLESLPPILVFALTFVFGLGEDKKIVSLLIKTPILTILEHSARFKPKNLGSNPNTGILTWFLPLEGPPSSWYQPVVPTATETSSRPLLHSRRRLMSRAPVFQHIDLRLFFIPVSANNCASKDDILCGKHHVLIIFRKLWQVYIF